MKLILIIDDNAVLRRLIRWSLEGMTPPVVMHEATNGAMALQMASELKPDLVLLDVMMPGIDGMEVCRQIKAKPELSHTRVILVSALGQRNDTQRGMDAGADAYMVKPFSPAQLIETVAHLLVPAAPASVP